MSLLEVPLGVPPVGQVISSTGLAISVSHWGFLQRSLLEVHLGIPLEVPLGEVPLEVPLGEVPLEIPLGEDPMEVTLGVVPLWEVPLDVPLREVTLGEVPLEVHLGVPPVGQVISSARLAISVSHCEFLQRSLLEVHLELPFLWKFLWESHLLVK